MQSNTLYFGDNLRWLRDRDHFPDGSVDLVYLDPPFNSKRDYNMVFKDQATADDTAQIKAFEDTWSFDGASEDFHYVATNHDRLSRLLEALKLTYSGDRNMLGMVGYLAVMAARLIELHRVLKPTGSLYLHCDPTASHYLKMVLDAVFGADRFLSEIIWKRTSAHSSAKRCGPVHDVILHVTKSEHYLWVPQYQEFESDYLALFFDSEDETGRRYKRCDLTGSGVRHGETGQTWRGLNVTAKGRHWARPPRELDQLDLAGRIHWPSKPGGMPRLKQYPEDLPGVPLQDIWGDIRPIHNLAAERLGYPTQKPLALLERIIAASSNEGDVVLDPFCGCGTAVVAAQKLGRRWLGIDVTSLATSTIRKRLAESFPDAFPSPASIPVVGFPADVAGARALAGIGQDLGTKEALAARHNYQNWILSLIPTARPKGDAPKKGADQGVDGLWLWQDGTGATQRGIISVKSGHVKAGDVRDLVGTVNREGAAMGLFLTLEPPTKPMLDEAAVAGRYELAGTSASFPRLQIVTAEELLAGRLPQLPQSGRIEAFKAAKPVNTSGQGTLDLE